MPGELICVRLALMVSSCLTIALWVAVIYRLSSSSPNRARAGVVHIFDRQGNQVVEVQLESRAQTLVIDWDKDGEVSSISCSATVMSIWQ